MSIHRCELSINVPTQPATQDTGDNNLSYAKTKVTRIHKPVIQPSEVIAKHTVRFVEAMEGDSES